MHQIEALIKIFLLHIVSHSGILEATFDFKGPVREYIVMEKIKM